MHICSIREKPVMDDYITFHFKCYEETLLLMLSDDVDYETEPEMKPVRQIKKTPKQPPIEKFKQPKPLRKNAKIVIEKEYIPLVNVSYDPNDTTIYI
jgi:hypothetical protein